MRNTKKIKLTFVRRDYDGVCNEPFMRDSVMLRTARHAGDIETVNHYVLGNLNRYKKFGVIDYEVIE